jgi:co-chaperonin GroES (HSP10)
MYKIEGVDVKQEDEAAIPIPIGYRLLIALPEVEKVTKGGIHIPDKLVDMEKVASVVGLVVSMGDLCYKDPDKFPTGPWCKEGDYVIFRSYSGTRLKVGTQEFRLINDDTVEAVVDDPRKIVRAF